MTRSTCSMCILPPAATHAWSPKPPDTAALSGSCTVITDPHLRFWFRFCAPELAHIERGRADLALSRYDRDYQSWRGRAIEPIVHGALNRLAADPGSEFAGAFILAPTGMTPLTGKVMLYSPSEEFEEFENLARLNDTVAARIQDGAAPGKLLIASLPTAARAALSGLPVLTTTPSQIDADVIADSVRALRVRQHFSVREALRRETLPSTGELDLAADLTPQWDVANAFMVRNLRLLTASTWRVI